MLIAYFVAFRDILQSQEALRGMLLPLLAPVIQNDHLYYQP